MCKVKMIHNVFLQSFLCPLRLVSFLPIVSYQSTLHFVWSQNSPCATCIPRWSFMCNSTTICCINTYWCKIMSSFRNCFHPSMVSLVWFWLIIMFIVTHLCGGFQKLMWYKYPNFDTTIWKRRWDDFTSSRDLCTLVVCILISILYITMILVGIIDG